MGLTTDFNQSPYFDDFDENKNFHRVLFKPAVALQAREVTQLQTILQNQIERFGDNILTEGTIIQGGNFREEKNLEYIKVLDIAQTPLGTETSTDVNQYVGLKAVSATTGVEAIVVYTIYGLETQSPDLSTLYLKYTKGAQVSDVNVTRFSAGEFIVLYSQDANGDYTVQNHTLTIATTVVDTAPVGRGYGVRCGEGIIYQKGNFVRFENALTIVSKYSNKPDGVVVGFQTNEIIIDSNADSTLLDNAEGFSNEQAPGADRLQLIPSLVVLTIAESRADDSFFAIQEYANGKVVRRKLTTQYNQIQKEMERRTSEESGDYVVNRFDIYASPDPADSTKINAYIGPGLAYVDGMRVQLFNEISLPIDDATTFSTAYNQDVNTNIGAYVDVSPTVANKPGRFSIDTLETVNLVDGTNATIGTARIRAFTKLSATAYRAYLFVVKMNSGKVFTDVRKIKSTAFNGDVTVTLTDGKAKIVAETFSKVIFPLGKSFIKSANSAQTSCIYRNVKSTAITSNTFTIALTSGDDTNNYFPYAAGSLLPDNLLDIVVNATSADGTSIANNEVLEISSASLDSAFKNLTVNLVKTPSISINIATQFNVKSTNIAGNNKTLKTVYVKIQANTNVGSTTGKYSLGVPDVYDLVGVWRGANTVPIATLEANATANSSTNRVLGAFSIVKNDFDSHYGLSSIRSNGSVTIGANDQLIAKIRVFDRGTSGGNFVMGQNYPIDDTSISLPVDKIRTESIPTYTAADGTILYLRDYIDLRPYAANTVAYAEVASSAPTNPSATEAFSSSTKFPVPNKMIETEYGYYLGRNDMIIIDRNGEFVLVKGTPAEEPGYPAEPTKGMLLARLSIPPFPTLDSANAVKINKPSYGVSISSNQTQRYTMKDIGGIDQRIKNIEYYTSLSLLENSAKDFQVTDANGANRFKNGIFVDNFSSLALADIRGGEFKAANEQFNLSPPIRQYSLGLKYLTSTNANTYSGKAATLTKGSDIAMDDVSQPYATAVKNCTTSFYNYAGNMVIYPEYDGGPDTKEAPAVNLTLDLVSPFTEFVEELSEFIPLTKENVETIGNRIITTTSELQVSSGGENNQELGDFVTNVNFKPFMRGKNIQIKAVGMRPNTRFYFFFDGVNVNSRVARAIDYVPTTENSDEDVALLTKIKKSLGKSIISDADGVVRAVFVLPAATYYVGDRKIEILDINSLADKDAATSYASATYSAFNFAVKKTSLTATTLSPKFESAITAVTSETRKTGSDPIAQTFIIDSDRSDDTDIMVTKVDIFFAKKSKAGKGVGVQICEVENGIPTGIPIPYSRSHLSASKVNAGRVESTTATAATTFTFRAPVALKTNKEYAIMIAPDANDPDYLVWICRTGGIDVDTKVAITQDTNAGVLFTSTNAKTWTPYQNENLKFTLYAANFTASAGTLTLTNDDNEFFNITDLSDNFNNGEEVFIKKTTGFANGTVAMTNSSSVVTGTGTAFLTNYKNDKHIIVKDGTTYSAYKIKTVTSNTSLLLHEVYDGDTTATLNHYASPVGKMQYYNGRSPSLMILEKSSAETGLVFSNSDVIIGEDSQSTATIAAVKSLQMSYIQPMIHRLNFTKTRLALRAELYGTNGSSGLTPSNLSLTRTNYLTNDKYVIPSASMLATDRFKLHFDMSNLTGTTSFDTSPLVDFKLSTIMVGEYQINAANANTALDDSNERKSQSTAMVRYVNKPIQLAEGMDAEDLRIILGAYKPTGTDIRVYAKFLSATDNRNFSGIEWTRMYIRPETESTSSSVNRLDWREFEYVLGTSALGNGLGAWSNSGVINYKDDDGALYTSFKYFAIKVVMTSDSFSVVPRLRDVRAIAGT